MPHLTGDVEPAGQEPSTRSRGPDTAGSPDYPVREYVGAMAGQLARMARMDGDERLAVLLDIAAGMAAQPHPMARPA